jgi:hypothetical protein
MEFLRMGNCSYAVPARLTTNDLPEFLDELFGRFNLAFTAANRSIISHIGGCRFHCRTDSVAYSGLVRRGWADDETELVEDLELERSRADESGDGLIVASHSDGVGLPSAPRWAEPHFRERDVEAFLAPTRYRVHHQTGFWQLYDRETGRGIQLVDPRHGPPPWDSGSPLRNFLRWHLARPNRDLLHAGTLAVDGIGILLAGPGGSGKSGTVLAGLANGLETVGDDYVLATIDASIIAQPLFKTLKQDPAGISRLGLGGHRVANRLNWQGKLQFTLADLDLPPQPRRIAIRALCLPAITGENQTRFVPAQEKEAFLALAPSGVSQIPGDRGAMFGFAAKVSRQLPAYRLLLGTDPGEIAAAVRGFLSAKDSQGVT